MRRILIANIFGIGDVLFTTPLIANLKRAIPSVRIDYLCNARTQDIVKDIPEVSRFFIYEKDDFIRVWQKSKVACLKAVYRLFSNIHRERYDAIFDFTLSREFGLFFKLAGIRQRIGLNYKNRGIFLTDKISFNGFESRHVIEYYLSLLAATDIPVVDKKMHLVPDKDSLKWVQDYLKEKEIDEERLVAIVPGGGTSWGKEAGRKRWTSRGFSFVIERLGEKGFKIALLGDIPESALCKEIADNLSQQPEIIENNLNLKHYIALISKCSLVVCNDGGPLHIARALGVKTVSMFGPVDERVYGPYPASSEHIVFTSKDVPCRPCYSRFKVPECRLDNKCLNSIDPQGVVNICLKLLEVSNNN